MLVQSGPEDFLLRFSSKLRNWPYLRRYLFNGRTSKIFHRLQNVQFLWTYLTNKGLARQSRWCWISCFAALAPNSLLTCSFDLEERGRLSVLAQPPGPPPPPPTFLCQSPTCRLPSRLAYPPHLSAIKPARRYFISQNYCGLDDISDRRDPLVPPHCWLAQFLKQSSCFITSTWSLLSLFPYRDRPPAFCCSLWCQSFLVQTHSRWIE